MYIYNELLTDDICCKKKNSIIRKLRMNAGMVDIYLICLATNNDNFDIIDCSNLKQKGYPKRELMILGMAKGKDAAIELAANLFLLLSDKYGMNDFKETLTYQKDILFRRY